MTLHPDRTGPSAAAAADVVESPAAARPEPAEANKAAETASMATAVGSQAPLEKDLGAAAAGATGGHEKEKPLAHQNGQQADAEVVAAEAEAAAKLELQVAEPVIARFVAVKDVKTMLQTGLLEGKRIVYKNKKEKIDLLHGVIKGTAYFCLCGGYCDKTGKELSAKSSELHAKGESHNPNDHIFLLQLSTMSLFEMSKKLKEATDASMLQRIFNSIVQPDDPAHSQNKASTAHSLKAPANVEDYSMILNRLQLLEKRMEQFEKKVDQINQMQSQINTIEQNVEFLVNQTVRSRKLFEEVSKVFGKFSDI